MARKRLTIELEPNEVELFKKFKSRVALDGKTMKEAIVELIKLYLTKK